MKTATAKLLARWDKINDDRKQELMFIGLDFNEEEIRARLDACLVKAETQKGFEPQKWRHLRDPFPAWERKAEE